MSAFATRKLTKRFGSLLALDDVTLDVPSGGVVGLVGPNGSGKSTLIRILLGLINASAGDAAVLGCPISHPTSYVSRVGALIESPAFVPALSARANLRSLAQLRGVGLERVDDVLAVVGLSGRDREPVKRFSLGMKQRLGIAAALLADPELLVLDEPTNGLDPAGIVEIRQLLRQLAAAGRTVVVSSHLLSEIEAACDRLVVIRFGRLLYAGSTAELLTRGRRFVDLAPEFESDLPLLADALASAGCDATQRGSALRVAGPAGSAAELNRLATSAGITLSALVPVQDTLEDVFLRLTGADGERVPVAAGASTGEAA